MEKEEEVMGRLADWPIRCTLQKHITYSRLAHPKMFQPR